MGISKKIRHPNKEVSNINKHMDFCRLMLEKDDVYTNSIIFVELLTIMEDQEFRSNEFTNAEVLRPCKTPNEHMSYSQEFLGIQDIKTLVKDVSLVKAPKTHDIQDHAQTQE